jgi:integrase
MQAAGRAAGTVRLHRHYLGLLAEHYPAGPWRLTPGQLEKFMAKPSWSPETRKSARQVLTGFYRWAHGRGFIDDNPALYLPSVSVPPPNPQPYPEHLVRLIARDDDRVGYMAMLAAYAGARCGEIAKVRPERDLVGDELTLHGKGGKQRVVPVIYPPLLRLLERDRVRGGWAFPNGRGSHLSPGHVTKLLSNAMPDGWTGHKLRHRLATQAHNGTLDLLAVKEILGHSRLETTLRYVKMPDDAKRRAIAAACSTDTTTPTRPSVPAGSGVARAGQDSRHLGLSEAGEPGRGGRQTAGVVDELNDQLVPLLSLLLDRLGEPGQALGGGLDPLGQVRQVVDDGRERGGDGHGSSVLVGAG